MIVLHHQGKVAGILVGAHPLAAAPRLLSRVVDELHVLVGGTANALVKHPGRLLQHFGEGIEQGKGDGAQPILPGQQLRLHPGQGGRPLVGADQPLPGMGQLGGIERCLLVHDIELFPLIRPRPGQLGPHLVVAAKMGGVHHLHRQLLLRWQGEEAGRERQGFPLLPLGRS